MEIKRVYRYTYNDLTFLTITDSIADVPPIKQVYNPFAIERPHATPSMLERQGSFRGFTQLNQASPFKRQLSLRINDLPSNLERTRSHSLEPTDLSRMPSAISHIVPLKPPGKLFNIISSKEAITQIRTVYFWIYNEYTRYIYSTIHTYIYIIFTCNVCNTAIVHLISWHSKRGLRRIKDRL